MLLRAIPPPMDAAACLAFGQHVHHEGETLVPWQVFVISPLLHVLLPAKGRPLGRFNRLITARPKLWLRFNLQGTQGAEKCPRWHRSVRPKVHGDGALSASVAGRCHTLLYLLPEHVSDGSPYHYTLPWYVLVDCLSVVCGNVVGPSGICRFTDST